MSAAQRLWASVGENKRQLESCTGHAFVAAGPINGVPQFICERCCGEVSESERDWYERGLEHGAAAE